MKKDYVVPHMIVVEVKTENILESSYIPVGGSGKPKARRRDITEDLGDGISDMGI